MSAAVISLSEFAARRGNRVCAPAADKAPVEAGNSMACGACDDVFQAGKIDFCFWQGASGERYVHHVYSLIGCPQIAAGNYVMLARSAEGVRTPLHVGRVSHDAPSLNLAEIRRIGATLGAAEVHVHLLAKSEAERCVIELDLRAGLGLEPDTHPLSA